MVLFLILISFYLAIMVVAKVLRVCAAQSYSNKKVKIAQHYFISMKFFKHLEPRGMFITVSTALNLLQCIVTVLERVLKSAW